MEIFFSHWWHHISFDKKKQLNFVLFESSKVKLKLLSGLCHIGEPQKLRYGLLRLNVIIVIFELLRFILWFIAIWESKVLWLHNSKTPKIHKRRSNTSKRCSKCCKIFNANLNILWTLDVTGLSPKKHVLSQPAFTCSKLKIETLD